MVAKGLPRLWTEQEDAALLAAIANRDCSVLDVAQALVCAGWGRSASSIESRAKTLKARGRVAEVLKALNPQGEVAQPQPQPAPESESAPAPGRARGRTYRMGSVWKEPEPPTEADLAAHRRLAAYVVCRVFSGAEFGVREFGVREFGVRSSEFGGAT